MLLRMLASFIKVKGNKDSLSGSCKLCVKERRKVYREANKDKIKKRAKQYQEANKEKYKGYVKEYYNANNERYKELRLKNKDKRKQYLEENKEKLREKKWQYDQANKKKVKEYYRTNKERIRVVRKKYLEANKEKSSEYSKKYREVNKDRVLEYSNQYQKSRRKTDNLYRLKLNIRANIHRYLKDGKSKRTREIIGIDYKEFQDYLEVEYTEGMHLDHIIPLSWSINDEEVYILNHYSNFQIITAEENQAKSDSYCKSENLKKVLDNHNNITKLNKIIERNSDKIK